MSSTAGKWREEQILIICPGSQTTLAQLGCNELTLPTHRIPTRMFKDGNEWRPYHTYQRTKIVGGVEEEEWVEDVDSDEGATFPIRGGHIVEMDAFLAFLDHVHGLLTTTYHNTPIMLMASPQWTRPDCESIARYIFEKTRTPALCIIHSGIATQYGLKYPNMTVIDVGYEKVDVTAIYDGSVVNETDVGAADGDEEISGGQVFTKRLQKLLASKDFTYDMAEQLKKSTICEVLPYVGTSETLSDLPVSTVSAAAAAAAPTSAPGTQPAAGGDAPAQEQQKPTNQQNNGGDDEGTENENNDEDGVLDVAAIVTSGQTKEFLARKEQEKTKGKPGRKPKSQEEAAPAKPVRLPNSKRTHNTFYYEEIVQEEVPREPKEAPKPAQENGAAPDAEKTADGTAQPPAESAPTEPAAAPTEGDGPKPDVTMTDDSKPAEPKPEPTTQEGASTEAPKPEQTEPAPTNGVEATPAEPAKDDSNDTPEFRAKRIRRDVEVGLERFTFAERHQIDRIVSAIYRTVQGIDEMYMRPQCWENLVFVGNGSRLRGLKENILQTLIARHLVSPSTATMFTSELPSNMATPTGTGSQTPVGSYTGAPHQLSASGVNPLLQAATTAGLGAGNNNASSTAVGTPQAGSEAAGPVSSHHFHSQTPTNIRIATMPGYLSEWTKHGFEEAMFLGAQVAARMAFCLHSNMDAGTIEAQRLMSLSRVDYK
ncbi:Actin-like protein arp9 (SWI/SNF complex component arp9) [Lecanicillium sp. MT-2017a]|nr:Actin-like protein arp9 (SWI/SNF complex component arp9) [Lecanicillium sp. MT-2017a]